MHLNVYASIAALIQTHTHTITTTNARTNSKKQQTEANIHAGNVLFVVAVYRNKHRIKSNAQRAFGLKTD